MKAHLVANPSTLQTTGPTHPRGQGTGDQRQKWRWQRRRREGGHRGTSQKDPPPQEGRTSGRNATSPPRVG